MREYQVTIAGVDTTVQLSDEDAERAGATANRERGGNVSNKARSTEPGVSGTVKRRRKSDDAGDDE